LLVSAPTRVFAWDPFGHRMIAASAWEQIRDKAVRKRIGALLRLNPRYGDWVAGVPAGDRDRVAFIEAATWPDFIKQAPGYVADGAERGNRPDPVPASSQNIGYADKLMHKYWHFIDVPLSPDGTPTQAPDFVNARTQIKAFRAALKSASVSDDVKSYDLVWLEHIVADVHQPLHCTSRFDATQKDGDSGGNFVKLTGDPSTLHALWDNLLGTANTDRAAAVAAARKLQPPPATLATVTDEAAWIDEGVAIAKSRAYVDPIGVGEGPFTVNAAYTQSAEAAARTRAALAAARLARLLIDALEQR
jgi:hypothetical protein